MKILTLYVDQYGRHVYARTVKELRDKCCGGRASIMYCDTEEGKTVRKGYVVGQRWFTAYVPKEYKL